MLGARRRHATTWASAFGARFTLVVSRWGKLPEVNEFWGLEGAWHLARDATLASHFSRSGTTSLPCGVALPAHATLADYARRTLRSTLPGRATLPPCIDHVAGVVLLGLAVGGVLRARAGRARGFVLSRRALGVVLTTGARDAVGVLASASLQCPLLTTPYLPTRRALAIAWAPEQYRFEAPAIGVAIRVRRTESLAINRRGVGAVDIAEGLHREGLLLDHRSRFYDNFAIEPRQSSNLRALGDFVV
ncbi:MAG: hypothetical protein MUF34_27810 [Polyangiaceae bacterium]|nr:hypothetical protein [Polyangiaceae bacterium]